MERPLLEVCVDTLDGCRAAVSGGADRLELCAALALGGLTPSAAFVEHACALVRIPGMVMIRPRAGDFVYDADELAAMERDIAHARDAGARGVVLGVLRAGGGIDVERTRALVAAARPLDVTFHRAFDLVPDQHAALDALIELGVTRVLTSGGAEDAPSGTAAIATLVERAAGRIGVLPGGGVRPDNAAALVAATGAREVHGSCSSSRAGGALLPGEPAPRATDVAVVRALRAALNP